jgi:hypothetical protein
MEARGDPSFRSPEQRLDLGCQIRRMRHRSPRPSLCRHRRTAAGVGVAIAQRANRLRVLRPPRDDLNLSPANWTYPRASAKPRSDTRANGRTMNVLVVDVGGTHVKILATGKREKREFASGPALTAPQMVSRVRTLAKDWSYQAVSIGYPGPVLHNRPVAEPRNLGSGWMGFNFEEAFKRPTRIINDAAMQALGSYRNGKMLFLGLGTGLGSTLIADGILELLKIISGRSYDVIRTELAW